ncbi:MAG: PEP-CTERM sorting domain-containing protein [Burkholderiales bacterium]|nr:PEP-CTERM sorting domain-containing protein [Phycisphaerae bacterium]
MLSKSILKVAAATAVGVLGFGQAADAALTVEFRFNPTVVVTHEDPDTFELVTDANNGTNGATYSGDNKTATLTTLSPIAISLYGRVTGATNGTAAREGLQSAIVAAISQIVSPGIAGSITRTNLGPSWTGSGAESGLASNLSADGVGDWGSTAQVNNTAGQAFFRPRTGNATTAGAPVNFGLTPAGATNAGLGSGNGSQVTFIGADASANVEGYEHLLGYLIFKPTAVAPGTLVYNPAVPALGGTTAAATWNEDSTNVSSSNNPNGGKTPASGTFGVAVNGGVTLNVVPEPTTLGLAGLAGLGLLRRRRA